MDNKKLGAFPRLPKLPSSQTLLLRSTTQVALSPPSPPAPAPLSQAWEQGGFIQENKSA
ncbi:hypothetical protein [Chamaesiphon polymorphus]|uniref:hypothetical protein n=1 Tax=Chamaesiphon polymorphus TaxID=2107691 RepID=UPI0015E71932|nr:hypothetical protein [Chamaesiphon polymorphus]